MRLTLAHLLMIAFAIVQCGAVVSTKPAAAQEPVLRANTARRYVNSIFDFEDHVASHRERVKRLGLKLLAMYPNEFRDVSPAELEIYLDRHDLEKIQPEFARVLYSNYGKTFTTATGEKLKTSEEAKKSNEMIARMNERGTRFVKNFFTTYNHGGRYIDAHGAETALARKFQLIELIADKVDRYRSPLTAEEFGRPMSSASSYLLRVPFNGFPQAAKMAAELEVPYVYSAAVQGSTYEQYRHRRMHRTPAARLVQSCLNRNLEVRLGQLDAIQ